MIHHMKKYSSIIWLIAATLFATGAAILLLSYMVTDPGHVMIQLGGDCGKNYYTYLYHSLYDNGVWFGGMNYPYGEHIIYADGQPILSSLLNMFKPLQIRTVLAIMNLVISLSYVLAIVFTYKILDRFGVKLFLAILFACLIILLAPQVMRLRAHFALAYACPIPMLFYWVLRYHDSSHWKWLAYIFIMGCIMSFIHLYIGGIIFVWIAFYTVGYLILIKKPLKDRIMHVVPLLVSAVSIFLVIKLCVALTDPVTDRPSFPFRTPETDTHLNDILTSPYSPFWKYARDRRGFKNVADATGEGYSYLGFATIIIVLLSFLAGITRIFRKKPGEEPLISEAGFSPVWIFVAVGSLLLAMGIPFIWNMEWLFKYLSVFRQFRSLGRFSWIFYYIISMYGVVVIHSFYSRYRAKGKPVIAYGIVCCVLLVWGLDARGYIKYTRGYIADALPTCDHFFNKEEPVKWPQFLEEHYYHTGDFQGLILYPFFVQGSEKLWLGRDPSWQFSIGMSVALQYHLPMVDVMMSRTSWSVTEKQVKTIGGPYADKPMLRDLKNKKPFLLLQYVDAAIDPDQQYLYKASDFLGSHMGCYVYACYPERILANDQKYADTINAILPYMHNADSCIGVKGTIYIDHFDAQHGDHIFGTGGSLPITGDDSVIKTLPVMPAWPNQMYELSAWFLVGSEDYRSPTIDVKLLDSSGNEIGAAYMFAKESTDNYNMWFRATKYFEMPAKTRYLKFSLNNRPRPTYKAMDELQLRPAGATIISKAIGLCLAGKSMAVSAG
jgi:hypothetical protein